MIDNSYKEELRKEAQIFRDKKLKELKGKKDRSANDNYFLEMLEQEEFKRRTDDEILKDNYYKILHLFDYWMDIKDEYKNIGALWVIGTYMHKEFDSYPFLFINAMRGSGKTRFMRLMKHISLGGELSVSMTEAVMFRTKGALFIDEFESVGNKEKQALRELLNASYKKGTKIFRMKQKKTIKGTEQILETFEPYRPICMANIWGMDEIVGDRAITMILEKSCNKSKVQLLENFEDNNLIKTIKNQFNLVQLCSLMQFMQIKKTIEEWNNYIKMDDDSIEKYIYTLTTQTTDTTQTTLLNQIKRDKLFAKIKKYDIYGRNLEIFMPILLIAQIIGEDVLDFTLKTAGDLVYEKRHDEEIESKDVLVIDFISRHPPSLDYYSIKQLTIDFKNFCDSGEEWLNEKWFGRALKRLDLIIDKRRVSKGIEATLNIAKAKQKIKMFKMACKEVTEE